ncbi:MAG: organomercurial lyase [Candidatus Dormiibacterota bacterium]
MFIPVIVGRTARVESVCSATGQRIVLTVEPGRVVDVSPPGAVISFLRPQERFDSDVILNFCHHVLFFGSQEAGEEWIRERKGAMLLSLEQGFDLGAKVVDEKFAAARHCS